jgi:hypothetical protein
MEESKDAIRAYVAESGKEITKLVFCFEEGFRV